MVSGADFFGAFGEAAEEGDAEDPAAVDADGEPEAAGAKACPAEDESGGEEGGKFGEEEVEVGEVAEDLAEEPESAGEGDFLVGEVGGFWGLEEVDDGEDGGEDPEGGGLAHAAEEEGEEGSAEEKFFDEGDADAGAGGAPEGGAEADFFGGLPGVVAELDEDGAEGEKEAGSEDEADGEVARPAGAGVCGEVRFFDSEGFAEDGDEGECGYEDAAIEVAVEAGGGENFVETGEGGDAFDGSGDAAPGGEKEGGEGSSEEEGAGDVGEQTKSGGFGWSCQGVSVRWAYLADK